MRLEIRSQGLDLGQGLRGFIEHRLQAVLQRFGPRIGQVTIYLADLNGPRGGIDKRCRIVAQLLQSGQISVEDTNADLGAVLNRAMDRMGQSVRQKLERRHNRERRLATRRGHLLH